MIEDNVISIEQSSVAVLSKFLQLIDTRKAIWLSALSIGSALTEGVGLVLLVPMLGILGEDSRQGTVGWAMDWLGIPHALLPLLMIFVTLVAIRGVLNMFRMLAAQQLEVSLIEGLRGRAWRALLGCNWRVLSQLRHTDSASLLISGLERVLDAAHHLITAGVSVVTLVFILLAALVISPVAAVAALVGGALALLAYRRMRRRAAAIGNVLNRAYARVHAEIGEGLAALRVIKSFGIERAFETRLRTEVRTLRRAERDYVRDLGLGQALLQTSGAIALGIIVWGAVEVAHSPLATALPIVALFARALPLIATLQEAWQGWAHSRPALDETMELISLAEAGAEPDLAPNVPLPEAREAIHVAQVGVAYPERAEPVLVNIDIELAAGTITAVIGPSGSGKSTLADILGGLLAPDQGSVLIDGVALDGTTRRGWRRQVAYVQQDAVLFTGTVRDNLTLIAPDANDDELKTALRKARADFVELLPNGLDTPLGEGGRQLSGGERQRIALARALLRRPRLLILDEAASALDAENETAIARAIASMRGEMTIFIIGHRGALAEIADRTLRIEGGRLQP